MRIKKDKDLKVFHGLVNYGSQAGLFAKTLRANGIEALSVSVKDKYKRFVDIEINEGITDVNSFFNYFFNFFRKIYWFTHYNTFHFYFGSTLFPWQIDLPFYKFFGKKVVMEYLGYDVQLYEFSIHKYEITNVRFYKDHNSSIKFDTLKLKRLGFETKYIVKQFVCAPYISEFVPSSAVLPLGIDLKEYQYSPKEIEDNKIVILHAPTSRDNKGTSYILNAIELLITEGYNIELELVENLSHADLKLKYASCDLMIDQILAGWYGTASIEAMAIGRPVICFLRESYFEFINYGDDIPIINADPNNIYAVLKRILDKKEILPDLGKKSRAFVENVHDINVICKNLINFYKEL